jgi:hypothetical protein
MPDVLYVPLLKGRQGEFSALAEIQPLTRQHILPLVELVPAPTDDRSSIKAIVDKSVSKLRTWAGHRLLDAGYLATEVDLGNQLGAVAYSVMKAHEEGIAATPVARLNDEDQALSDAAAIHRDFGGGVSIRLGTEDLEEDPEDVVDTLQSVMSTLGVRAPDVDLVFDLGTIAGDLAVHAGARFVADLLRNLPTPGDWRQIVVAGGAFPSDLSSVAAWKLGEFPRYDAQLFDRLLQRRRIPRQPTYGDYAVAHPELVLGNAFPAPPQLRYTVADRWLVLKGRRNDPRGHDQFFMVCEHISQHPEFVGEALGKADARIAHAKDHGPGNASTWRQIATTHHLDYLVQRLTSLGEP